MGNDKKLLHRLQGPYTVVCRLTSLNYEVQLSGNRNTELVHVERLKRFVVLNGVVNRQEAGSLRADKCLRQPVAKGDKASRNSGGKETESLCLCEKGKWHLLAPWVFPNLGLLKNLPFPWLKSSKKLLNSYANGVNKFFAFLKKLYFWERRERRIFQ